MNLVEALGSNRHVVVCALHGVVGRGKRMATVLVTSPHNGCITLHWTITGPEPCTLQPVAYPEPDSTEHVPLVIPSGNVPFTSSVSFFESRSAPADTDGGDTRVIVTVALLSFRPLRIVHMKVVMPSESPSTIVKGSDGFTTVALAPFGVVQAPMPLRGALPARVTLAKHTFILGPASATVTSVSTPATIGPIAPTQARLPAKTAARVDFQSVFDTLPMRNVISVLAASMLTTLTWLPPLRVFGERLTMAFTMSVRRIGLMADTSSETSTMNVSLTTIVAFADVVAFVTIGVMGAGDSGPHVG